MIYTTLNKLKLHTPCSTSKETLLKHLGKTVGDDDPLSMELILDVLGIQDAIWCTRAFPEHHKTWALFIITGVKDSSQLMTDPRSIEALTIAEQFLNGEATKNQLEAAVDDAADAAFAVNAAAYANYAAYYAVYYAAAYANYAVNAANAAYIAYAANAAYIAYATVGYAVNAAIKKQQTIEFRALLQTL